MTCPSDGDLLRAYRGGDRDAFGVLLARHQAALLRHARALLGSGSTYEDVVQDAFLKLAQNPPELPRDLAGKPEEERAALAAWLHKVTRNGCMDVMRSEVRRKRREGEAALDEAHAGGMGTVEAADTRAAVERSLSKLPGDQREVLVLRLLGDRSYREIAEITGKKIGTVGWLISVGLRALSADLAPLVEGGAAGGAGARLDVVRGEL